MLPPPTGWIQAQVQECQASSKVCLCLIHTCMFWLRCHQPVTCSLNPITLKCLWEDKINCYFECEHSCSTLDSAANECCEYIHVRTCLQSYAGMFLTLWRKTSVLQDGCFPCGQVMQAVGRNSHERCDRQLGLSPFSDEELDKNWMGRQEFQWSRHHKSGFN